MLRAWLLVEVPATCSRVDTLLGANTDAVDMFSEPAL
jgi:hypothetical protein